jgi:hypothetical protein
VQYSPKESQPSTLTEEFRTLIQRAKEDWLGSSPLVESGYSRSTLHSGINYLATLIENTIDPAKIAEQMLNSLEMGDGTVDLPTAIAETTKRVVIDVIREYGKDQSNG